MVDNGIMQIVRYGNNIVNQDYKDQLVLRPPASSTNPLRSMTKRGVSSLLFSNCFHSLDSFASPDLVTPVLRLRLEDQMIRGCLNQLRTPDGEAVVQHN